MPRRTASFRLAFATAVAVSMIAAGCSSSAATQAAPGATVAPVVPGVSSQPATVAPTQAAATVAAPPAAGTPSCKVTTTGGLTVSWETSQADASGIISYWLSASAHKALSPTGESFLLNCGNGDASISLYTTGGTTAAKFPQAAGSYVINAQGAAATPGTVVATVAMTKGGLLWRVTEPGAFVVTTLDGSKFAGTFQMKIAEVGDNLQLTGKTASVAGTFDLACSSNTGNVCK
jgi:hypothetical protein